MKRNVIKLLVFSVFLSACNDGEAPLYKSQAKSYKPIKASSKSLKEDKIDEAIRSINTLFVAPSHGPNGLKQRPTPADDRVNLHREDIANVIDIRDSQKRILLKLLCFKPSGYALISALDSIPNPPVLLYSNGKFDEKNRNPGLVSYIGDFIANSRKTPVTTAAIGNRAPTRDEDQDGDGAWDDGRDSPTGDPRDSPYYHIRTVLRRYSKIKEQRGPLLTTYWNQDYPYNDECPQIAGQRLAAGCVAIAVGQIINYNRKDYLKDYDWNRINHSELPDIAEFIRDIGRGVHTDYGLGSSEANDKDALKYFRAAGYNAHLGGYHYASLKESIDRGKPVYLSGFADRRGRYFIIRWGFQYANGHAWVADGYKQVDDYEEVEEARGRDVSHYEDWIKSTDYIHMNWGWGPSSEGAYAWCTYDYLKTGSDMFKYRKRMIIY